MPSTGATSAAVASSPIRAKVAVGEQQPPRGDGLGQQRPRAFQRQRIGVYRQHAASWARRRRAADWVWPAPPSVPSR